MPVKQWPCPGTRNGALWDPSDKVKLRREAPCCIPGQAGRNSEEGS